MEALEVLFEEAKLGKLDRDLVEVFSQKVIIPFAREIEKFKEKRGSTLELPIKHSTYKLSFSDSIRDKLENK